MSDKILQAIEEYFSNPENVAKFQRDFELREARRNRYIEKLRSLSKEDRAIFVQKCIDKYESDEYRTKEYNKGYEPRCLLYDVILNYAERYGERLEPDEDFMDLKYKFDDYWIIALYIGQGSFIRIWKEVS